MKGGFRYAKPGFAIVLGRAVLEESAEALVAQPPSAKFRPEHAEGLRCRRDCPREAALREHDARFVREK